MCLPILARSCYGVSEVAYLNEEECVRKGMIVVCWICWPGMIAHNPRAIPVVAEGISEDDQATILLGSPWRAGRTSIDEREARQYANDCEQHLEDVC